MKRIIGLAFLLMFVASVFFFAPVGDTRASSMPQNDNTDMRGSQHHRRHYRRHHRMERRHHRRHHRRMGRHMGNSNM